jgi:hypothetical protein
VPPSHRAPSITKEPLQDWTRVDNRLPAVAEAILVLQLELCHCLVRSIHQEDGIIAKAVRSPFFWNDLSPAFPLRASGRSNR